MAQLGMNAIPGLERRALWSPAEIVVATRGTLNGDFAVTGVSIDSRTTEPGDLFVALVGRNHDAHRFVPEALERGAAAVMVARQRLPALPGGTPYIAVDNTAAGLAELAGAARARSAARIAAITGSLGKTGTKEALRLALGALAPTHAGGQGDNDSRGVPLSLARLPVEARYGAFELVAGRAGALAPLSRQLRPHVAIITNVEAANLETFGSLEAIAAAKAEIFEGLEPGGVAVLNCDNPQFARLCRAAERAGVRRVMGFGSGPEADVRLLNLALHPTLSCVTAEVDGVRMTYKIGVPGRHWVINSLAVLAAVKALGADLGIAGLALAGMTAPKGRGRRHMLALPSGEITLIDESLNAASPLAVQSAFEVLAATLIGRRGRRIVVLGDMEALGPEARAQHLGLLPEIERHRFDLVFAVGPNMTALHDALPASRRGGAAPTSRALAPLVTRALKPGDVVMVKGARGSATEQVVEAILALADRNVRQNGRR